jgi:hypothetical protein
MDGCLWKKKLLCQEVRDRGRQQQQVTSVASDVIIVLYFDIHVLYYGESREQTPTYDSRAVTLFGDLGGAMPQVLVAVVACLCQLHVFM